jgi:hypothetical protein
MTLSTRARVVKVPVMGITIYRVILGLVRCTKNNKCYCT